MTRLEISQFRNIEYAELAPGAHLNCLVGANGSGKTSVLEAIHLLGRARSFKTTRAAEMVRFEQSFGAVIGRLDDGSGGWLPVGVRLGAREREIRVRGRKVQSSAELLQLLPLLLIHPASVALVEGAPRLRRQFLDWGVFHVEHSYLDTWRRHLKALSQRNAALRSHADLEPWDQELARYGTILAEARSQYLARLQAAIDAAASHFFPGVEVRVRLLSGWADGKDLLEVLRRDRAADQRQGFTHSGPHKGDFILLVNGKPARAFLSRGQTKMMAYALLLAQASFLAEEVGPACVMIDDLASELDAQNQGLLLAYLNSLRAQCFITAVDRQDVAAARANDAAMFHVEQGRIVKV